MAPRLGSGAVVGFRPDRELWLGDAAARSTGDDGPEGEVQEQPIGDRKSQNS